MLLNVLLGVQIVVCFVLVGVILLQRSEGGALGMGGGGGGSFMTARGAGDLLTRITSIAAGAFFVLCLGLTLLAASQRNSSSITERLDVRSIDPSTLARPQQPEQPTATTPGLLPATPGAVAPAAALPLEAPTPQVRGPVPATAPGVIPAPGAAPAVRPAPARPAAAQPAATTPAPATTTPAPTPAPTTPAPEPTPAPATPAPAPAPTTPPATETPTTP